MKFSDREKLLAIKRLAEDNVTTTEEDTPRISSLKAVVKALSDWRTWIMVFGYMVIVGSSTLSYFYPTLVKGLGYSNHMAQYMVHIDLISLCNEALAD